MFIEDLDGGYIKLWRSLLKHRIWANKDLSRLWIWCLLKANYEEKWYSVTTGRGETEVKVPRGYFVFGRKKAATELKMKHSSIWKRLKKLKKLGFVNTQTNSHYSLIRVIEYDKFQHSENEEKQKSNTQVITNFSKNKNTSDFPNTQQNRQYSLINVLKHYKIKHTENENEQPSGKPSNRQVTGKVPKSNTTKNIKNIKNKEYISSFQYFWSLYPKKVGKKPSLNAWIRIRPDNARAGVIMEALKSQMKSEDWIKDGGKFIPHPATWLNQERWDDELKAEIKSKRHESEYA